MSASASSALLPPFYRLWASLQLAWAGRKADYMGNAAPWSFSKFADFSGRSNSPWDPDARGTSRYKPSSRNLVIPLLHTLGHLNAVESLHFIQNPGTADLIRGRDLLDRFYDTEWERCRMDSCIDGLFRNLAHEPATKLSLAWLESGTLGDAPRHIALELFGTEAFIQGEMKPQVAHWLIYVFSHTKARWRALIARSESAVQRFQLDLFHTCVELCRPACDVIYARRYFTLMHILLTHIPWPSLDTAAHGQIWFYDDFLEDLRYMLQSQKVENTDLPRFEWPSALMANLASLSDDLRHDLDLYILGMLGALVNRDTLPCALGEHEYFKDIRKPFDAFAAGFESLPDVLESTYPSPTILRWPITRRIMLRFKGSISPCVLFLMGLTTTPSVQDTQHAYLSRTWFIATSM
ncbi:hypothetical protein LXA43DRAFT_1101052 [Ganoderma leucocontextum]|nr:hypothetical protein LXA43DRAFT_1101052 [Ganoderma leucocontextum]